MAGKIFLCYRREDSAGHAGRIYDRLNQRFPGRVFMDVAGIRPELPGYEHVLISPTPGRLDHAEASFESVRGTIRSAWRQGFHLTVEIPANVTATVVVPGDGDLAESGEDASTSPGVHRVWREGGAWIAEIGSGTYEFRCS